MASLATYPLNPRHQLLAPVRTPKPRVTAPSSDIPKPTSAQLTAASQMIAKTGWLEMMEPLMPHAIRTAKAEHKGGCKPKMTLKALLTACLLLAIMERPMIIRDVWRLLGSGIDASSRKHLGLNPKTIISERMVSYAFGLIAAALNPSVHSESNAALFDVEKMKAFLGIDESEELDQYEHALLIDQILKDNDLRLDEFIHKGLAATHPSDAPHAGDYTLDGSFISSWEAPRKTRRRINDVDANGVKHRRPPRYHEMSDPDATWWRKGKDSAGLGYLVTAAVWMQEDCGVNVKAPDIPYLFSHFSVKTAKTKGADEGAKVIEAMIAHHEKEDEEAGIPDRVRGDITADREYSVSKNWQRRMHNVGLTPHFTLTVDQVKEKRTLESGAIVIEGIPYSPGMPYNLRSSVLPLMFSSKDNRAAIAAHNLQRAPFRLRVDGGARQDNGSLKIYCPASKLAKASISCANKPSSKTGSSTRIQIGTALPVITTSLKPTICSQSSVTVSFDELPYWQPYIPGTPEHQWSVNRRNIVESSFSRIKDEAKQSIRRGTFRVMGRAKVSLVVLFNSMAANMVEVERWELRKAGVFSLDAARKIKERMPRRTTRSRIVAANSRVKAAQKREALATLALEGLTVDLTTGEIIPIIEPPNTP